MAEICHDVNIHAPLVRVFAAVSQPKEINRWWTMDCDGHPALGSTYRFFFGQDFDWYAEVTAYAQNNRIVWLFTEADRDWTGTMLRMHVAQINDSTRLRLEHKSWLTSNEHFRRTSYCWAQYLRLLKNYLEEGVTTPYKERTFT